MSYKNIITTIVPKYRLSRQFYLQAGIFKYRFSMMIIVKDEFGKTSTVLPAERCRIPVRSLQVLREPNVCQKAVRNDLTPVMSMTNGAPKGRLSRCKSRNDDRRTRLRTCSLSLSRARCESHARIPTVPDKTCRDKEKHEGERKREKRRERKGGGRAG